MTSPQTLEARAGVPSVQSVLKSRWARLWLPSLSDLFILAILVWLFMSGGAAGWQGLLADGDVGWHIRSGEFVLDHHAVPRRDLYSFSKPGAPWYAWEWLSDVLDAWLFRRAGLKGVVLSAAIVIALFATTLIARMIRRRAHVFLALLVALLGVGAASIHFLARPHIFTLLLLSLSMWMIEADRDQPGRRIWWLAPMAAVWTNLHGGFLALVLVLGLCAAGSAVEAWLAARDLPERSRELWRQAARYAALTGACAAASLLNPYGYRLHLHVAEYLRSDWIRSVIQEFQSPSFRDESMLQFEALLLTGLIAAGLLVRRRKLVEALWIVGFAHLALGSVRHVPLYVTVAGPVIAQEISGWWKGWTVNAGRNSPVAIVNRMAADWLPGFRRVSLWPAVAVVGLVFIGRPVPWPQDFPAEMFPVKMVHAHAAQILESRVLTTDQWADYLIFTNPAQKVFIDGRSDFYGPEIGNQYMQLINGHWNWQQWMSQYGFNLALLPAETALSQLLKQSGEWQVVEDDGKRILFVRRTPPVASAGKTGPEPTF